MLLKNICARSLYFSTYEIYFYFGVLLTIQCLHFGQGTYSTQIFSLAVLLSSMFVYNQVSPSFHNDAQMFFPLMFLLIYACASGFSHLNWGILNEAQYMMMGRKF